tara:strand:- start:250 stop:996 length:747 start_codon:yes stop_codon:yes gene_type:complete
MNKTRHPFFKYRFQPFVHRGISNKFTENTYESFREVVKLGYKYIETDLQLTSDKKIITLHDSNLKRLSGVDEDIKNLSLREVKNLKLIKGGTIPELSELLDSFPKIRFNIDFKSKDTLIPTLDILDKHKAYDRVCLASFKSSILWNAKKLRPKCCISMGVLDTVFFKLFNIILNKADCIQIPQTWNGFKVLTKELIERAHKKNIMVHAWTVNDEKVMQNLIKLKIDGIMSDDAILLKKTSEKFNIFSI